MPAEKTGRKQRGRQFRKGESGNPAGRPKGALNKTTLACQALLDGEAEALTRTAIEKAKEGDMTALRLCLERLLPPRKDRPLVFDLPDVDDADGLEQASRALLRAIASGQITPAEGHALAAILEGHRKVVELTDIERRIAELEREREKSS